MSRGDINTFRNELNTVTENEKRKIFEVACQTPGCAQFIESCIISGCDVNKVCVILSSQYVTE